MREFINSFGEIVDLDDLKTYNHLPKTINKIEKLMFSEIGYSYCYMNFWHKELFNGKNSVGYSQKMRIKKLIKNFTKFRRENHKNYLWYREQLFLFQDEIENMC